MLGMLRFLALAPLLWLVACSGAKSQHEQAVEWQQFHGAIAIQLQQDLRLVQDARRQYQQTPTDANLTVLLGLTQKVDQDVNGQPGDAGRRSGPGSVGDAVQSLPAIEAQISRSAANIDDPDFAAAIERWNQAVSAIWSAGSGTPAPTV